MLKCALLRPEPRGFSREPGQDHRHYDNRHSQHTVLRPFFRLAAQLLLRFTILPLLVCLSVSIHPTTAVAQQTSDEDVIRVNTDLLLFPVRIRDKKGQAVAGLTEQDLSLSDQDRVTTGLYFAP